MRVGVVAYGLVIMALSILPMDTNTGRVYKLQLGCQVPKNIQVKFLIII